MSKVAHSKKLYYYLILFIFALFLTACANVPSDGSSPSTNDSSASGSQSTSNETLTILEWAGYDAPEYWQPFADEFPGVNVDFSFFAEDAEALSKVQSGYKVDLIHPCSPWIRQYVDLGLIQPIDTSKLSHWPDIDPELAEVGLVDGKQYMVPWEWGFEAILIRSDKIDKKPTSWKDLWDPAYKGHLSIFDSGEATWVITATALGIDPYNTSPEQQEQIKQKLIELKENVITYWTDSTELASMISSGDVWVAGDAWQDIYLTNKSEGIPVEYIIPEEGAISFVCGFVISSQTQNLDLAYKYIDAAIHPQSMANMANYFGFGPSNREALPLIDPELVEEFNLDDPEILKNTIFYRPLTSEQRELFTKNWSDVKTAP